MKCWFWCFKFKAKTKKWFSQFLCTDRQQTGLQNTQICFWLGGFSLPGPGRCPCTPPGPKQPLDPGHLGSVLPKHFFSIPMPDYCIQGQGHREDQNVNVCPDNIFYTIKHFVSKLGIQMNYYTRAHMMKVWQFLLYFFNCWSVCYQTLFDSTLS